MSFTNRIHHCYKVALSTDMTTLIGVVKDACAEFLINTTNTKDEEVYDVTDIYGAKHMITFEEIYNIYVIQCKIINVYYKVVLFNNYHSDLIRNLMNFIRLELDDCVYTL